MIDQCVENGADIIKLQNIFAQDLVERYEFETGFKKIKLCVFKDRI